jgi:hypothetical protein
LEFYDFGGEDDFRDVSKDIVNVFWNKITSLRGPSQLFRSNWIQPRKHFDKLTVKSIKSLGWFIFNERFNLFFYLGELKRVLRHDVDELEFDYHGTLSTGIL